MGEVRKPTNQEVMERLEAKLSQQGNKSMRRMLRDYEELNLVALDEYMDYSGVEAEVLDAFFGKNTNYDDLVYTPRVFLFGDRGLHISLEYGIGPVWIRYTDKDLSGWGNMDSKKIMDAFNIGAARDFIGKKIMAIVDLDEPIEPGNLRGIAPIETPEEELYKFSGVVV